METEKEDIQSVYRALSLLSLFSRRHPHLGITEIGRMMSLPKGTVHGIVRTLSKMGYLRQDPATRKYRLGLKIYELGAILADSLEINEKAASPVLRLVNRTRLTSRIAVWDGDSVLLTLNIDPRYHDSFVKQIGPRIPAYLSATGKAFLAFLEPDQIKDYFAHTELVSHTRNTITQKRQLQRELASIRRRGYSEDREESTPGVACLGAPIFGRDGRMEAAISLSGDPDRIFGGQKNDLVDLLLKTAGEVSRSLGFSEFFGSAPHRHGRRPVSENPVEPITPKRRTKR
jgi:DNA-binding IclR family transcriptional regulator